MFKLGGVVRRVSGDRSCVVPRRFSAVPGFVHARPQSISRFSQGLRARPQGVSKVSPGFAHARAQGISKVAQ
eukprot:7940024-Lingulodinium_polyedra.AAC.1